MSELVHGPVQPWKPSERDRQTIEQLLSSEDELDQAYGKAYAARCFVREFVDPTITAVGELDNLEVAGFRLDAENISPQDLSMTDCINLGAFPGTGRNRIERIEDGLRQVYEARSESE